MARLIGLFMLLSLVPLALVTWFTVRKASDAVTDEVMARVRSTAALSGVAIQKEMQGLGELVESYAKRPNLLAAIHPSGHDDLAQIDAHLSQLQQARPGIATAFLADPTGHLIDIVPATPSIVGMDFSYRDWYRGVTVTGRTYVSEAYQSLATGNPWVVAVATPVRDQTGSGGKEVAILVAAYDLGTIQGFVDRFAASQGVTLTVTDQRGVLLAAPGVTSSKLISLRGSRSVAAALKGTSGAGIERSPSGDVLSGYVPIGTLGWTATASVPSSDAFAGIGTLRSGVLSVAAII